MLQTTTAVQLEVVEQSRLQEIENQWLEDNMFTEFVELPVNNKVDVPVDKVYSPTFEEMTEEEKDEISYLTGGGNTIIRDIIKSTEIVTDLYGDWTMEDLKLIQEHRDFNEERTVQEEYDGDFQGFYLDKIINKQLNNLNND